MRLPEYWNYGGLAMQAAGRMAELATGKSEQYFRKRLQVPWI